MGADRNSIVQGLWRVEVGSADDDAPIDANSAGNDHLAIGQQRPPAINTYICSMRVEASLRAALNVVPPRTSIPRVRLSTEVEGLTEMPDVFAAALASRTETAPGAD